MENIFRKEFRPSYILVISGLGVMAASEAIQVKPVQEAIRNTGVAIAVAGVITNLAEQAIESAWTPKKL